MNESPVLSFDENLMVAKGRKFVAHEPEIPGDCQGCCAYLSDLPCCVAGGWCLDTRRKDGRYVIWKEEARPCAT